MGISTLSKTDNKMAAPKIFSRVAVFQAPSVGARNMATLKDIRLRLRSVMNIQKITKSMKMVSAAKYARAERELQPARVYGAGANSLLEKAEISGDPTKPNHLVLCISSDRGLCGGVHSGLAKAVKANLLEKPAGTNTFVKNLPLDATDEQIKILFSNAEEIRMLKKNNGASRGKAFIEMNSIENAEKASKI